MPKTDVPITPEVLRWAIAESGYGIDAVADAVGVSPQDVQDWQRGEGTPTLTQTRRLASFLHRTLAFFLLPEPPGSSAVQVQFRHLPGADARESLNPDERRYLRKAERLQRVLAWISSELDENPPALPRARIADDPEDRAAAIRELLGVPARVQLEWQSSSFAFDQWRERLEDLGIFVFLFSIGRESCRGFSVWNERAPLVAVNTAWNEEARIFTLFHELGHLVTRTNSACGEGAGSASKAAAWDPAERWCERFAAATLLPADSVRAVLRSRSARADDITTVRWLANRFKTSLRATAIRLIELRFATWDLFEQLPPAADKKREGGGGGGGRNRKEIREDQLGRRTATLFQRAVDGDVMNRSQALTYLDVADSDFEQLASH